MSDVHKNRPPGRAYVGLEDTLDPNDFRVWVMDSPTGRGMSAIVDRDCAMRFYNELGQRLGQRPVASVELEARVAQLEVEWLAFNHALRNFLKRTTFGR